MGNTVTFGAVGDIALAMGVSQGIATSGVQWPFERMAPILSRADLLFGNMETVLAPPDYPEHEIDRKALIATFAGPDCARALKDAGFDFLNLAANHVLDAGVVGMEYTRQTLEDAGLVTAGVGRTQSEARRPALVEVDGIRFGFLCYGEDSNYSLGTRGPCYAYYALDAVLEDVAKLRDSVDIVVVSVHADIEFMPTPSVPRLEQFRRIARSGANIILGHHPHVPQGCEMIDGCLVAYSLGNFIFPAYSLPYMKRHRADSAYSFVLLAEVARDGVRSFERIPFEIMPPPAERPHPAEGAVHDRMLRRFAELDGYLQDEDFLRRTWSDFAKRHFESYLRLAVEPVRPSRWQSFGRRVARRLGLDITPDIDLIVEELVGRLYFTAENRNCLEEVLRLARVAWEERLDEPPDPLHRPQHRLRLK